MMPREEQVKVDLTEPLAYCSMLLHIDPSSSAVPQFCLQQIPQLQSWFLIQISNMVFFHDITHFSPAFSSSLQKYKPLSWSHRISQVGKAQSYLKLNHVTKNVIQMFLELRQAGCHDHFPGEAIPVTDDPLMSNTILISSLYFPWSN